MESYTGMFFLVESDGFLVISFKNYSTSDIYRLGVCMES